MTAQEALFDQLKILRRMTMDFVDHEEKAHPEKKAFYNGARSNLRLTFIEVMKLAAAL